MSFLPEHSRLDPALSISRRVSFVVAYIATIPAANWLIGNVGQCVPNGPCLIPVAPGLMAPSGVLLIGIALVLRDAVHEALGSKAVLISIMIGTILSALIAPPALVVASASAFLLSEIADFAVYTPLRRQRLLLAVLLSGIVGAAIDSAVFLFVAFGSLDYFVGQLVGKTWASIAAVGFLLWRRK